MTTVREGDRVRILASARRSSGVGKEAIGRVGIIMDAGDQENLGVLVEECPGGARGLWWMRAEDVEVLARADQEGGTVAEHEWRNGDRAVLARVDDELAQRMYVKYLGQECVVADRNPMGGTISVRFADGFCLSPFRKNLDPLPAAADLAQRSDRIRTYPSVYTQEAAPGTPQVGDRVRIRHDARVWDCIVGGPTHAARLVCRGREGILDGDDGSNLPMHVVGEDGTPMFWWRREDVELVGRAAAQEPRETWSADLVLADGRAVALPGPDPACWELVEEQRIDPREATQFRASGTTSVVHGRNCTSLFVTHDEGRCWLADMARKVNATVRVSPFEERWAYATTLRRWRERPIVTERYSGCDSILACLW